MCYDIADDRRRRSVEQWLLGQGDRVLESVFECVWRAEQVAAAHERLSAWIKPAEDSLSLTPVCADCRRASLVDGQRRAAAHPHFHVV